jgi:ferritin-like metal-binding protein YciE
MRHYDGTGTAILTFSSNIENNQECRAMGLFSKSIKTLDDLFVHTLQDIYYAENQITKALPTMVSKATDPQLKQGFQTHLAETKGHIERLQRVFQMHGHSPKAVDCPAIDGIIKEANEIAGDIDDKEVLDAALVASAQAVEHYEITRYGTLIAWAKQLGRPDCASVLEKNLEEEKTADKKLTAIAESKVNRPLSDCCCGAAIPAPQHQVSSQGAGAAAFSVFGLPFSPA